MGFAVKSLYGAVAQEVYFSDLGGGQRFERRSACRSRDLHSIYNKGITEIHSLDQAVSRVGISVTGQLVDKLSRPKSWAMKAKKYRFLIENVWKHPIACADAAELAANLSNAKLSVDPPG